MPLSVRCPECQARYQVEERHAGKRFQCKQCESRIRIPALAAQTSSPATPDIAAFEQQAAPVAEFTIDTSLRDERRPRQTPIAAAQRPLRPGETAGKLPKSSRPPLEPMPVQVWWGLSITGGLLALLLVLGLIWPLFLLPFALLSALAATVLCSAGYIWCLVDAFGVDSRTGLMYLFVPFYPLYYLCTTFHRVWRPWLLTGLGLVMIPVTWMLFLFGVVSIFATDGEHNLARQSPPMQHPGSGIPGTEVMPMPDPSGSAGAPIGSYTGMHGGGYGVPPMGVPPYGRPPFGVPPEFAPPADGVQTVTVRLADERGDRTLEPQLVIDAEFASLSDYVAGSAAWNAERDRLTFQYNGRALPGAVNPYLHALGEMGFRMTAPPIFKPVGVR